MFHIIAILVQKIQMEEYIFKINRRLKTKHLNLIRKYTFIIPSSIDIDSETIEMTVYFEDENSKSDFISEYKRIM